MYVPEYNLEKNWKEIAKVIRENGFGILVLGIGYWVLVAWR